MFGFKRRGGDPIEGVLSKINGAILYSIEPISKRLDELERRLNLLEKRMSQKEMAR